MSRYRNDPKFSDRYVWANSADPIQLHCLLFHLHLLEVKEVFLCCKTNLFEFKGDYSNMLGVRKFRNFTVDVLLLPLQRF